MRYVRLLLVSLSSSLFLTVGCTSARQASDDRASAPTTGASIAYEVSIPDPKSETFQVTGTLTNIAGRSGDRASDTITFYFPIWAPGAYDIVNYGSYVRDFTATASDGRALTVSKIDSNSFAIVSGGSPTIRISYRVADMDGATGSLWFCLSDIEPESMTTGVRVPGYAFANATALFGYPAGYKEIPYKVTYVPPTGWDMTVALRPENLSSGRNTYGARNYDELVDAPVQMGEFQMLRFEEGGKPHIISVVAPQKLDSSDAAELVDVTRRIVRIQADFFGEMPYDQYLFQFYLVRPRMGESVFGALEHANSSTYRMPYQRGNVAQSLMAVISHEYWHLWSPKRFHVSELGPFDYQRAPRTKSLWFAEGLTEYYANQLLLRHDMTDSLELLADLNSRLRWRSRGQGKSLTEVSYTIADGNVQEALTLYSKGPIVGLLLDAAIRVQTNNGKSLDDAMRHFNNEYGRTGKSFTDDDIIPIMERATGTKLSDFYNRYIAGREALPIEEYLPQIGFALVPVQEERPVFGATINNDAWTIASIEPGASAEKMGLRVGDELVAIAIGRTPVFEFGEYPASAADQVLPQLTQQISSGVDMIIKRNGTETRVKTNWVKVKAEVTQVKVDPAATGTRLAIRQSMFGF